MTARHVRAAFHVHWPLLLILLVTVAMLSPLWLEQLAQPPLTYSGLPFPVIGPTHPGGPIRVRVNRCNTTGADVTYTFTRTLRRIDVDPIESMPLPLGGSSAHAGCEEVISVATSMPDGVAPGRYVIEAVTLARRGGREYAAPWSTEPFDVTP